MQRSYCIRCDAPTGDECGHDAPRYLEPLIYERTEEGGYRVPAAERERFDNPITVERPLVNENVVPIQRLVVQLEAFVLLDKPLEKRVRSAYDVHPGKVSRIVENVVAQSQAGRLHSPGGVLVAKLRELGA